jgi:carboxyl-terminal processing protease
MSNVAVRRLVVLVLLSGITGLVAPVLAEPAPVQSGADARPTELAALDRLRAQAIESILKGKFAQTNELLTKAAADSQDPAVGQMAGWIAQFEQQRSTFAAERRAQYDKAVADVHKLEEAGHATYAIDAARLAYVLADDKFRFRHEAWVDDLVKQSISQAEQAEREEHWLKALRIYSDLSAIEPSNPLWKEKLKLATRRVRLVGLYTPDVLKRLQEAESGERDQVDAILNPTTRPTTRPASLDQDLDDSFRQNWTVSLEGVQADMVWDALFNAREHYYRPVAYKDLMLGGLKGLEAIVTTRGLEEAFQGLSDDVRREEFAAFLRDEIRAAEQATPQTEQMLLKRALARVVDMSRKTVQIPEPVLAAEFADGAFGELDMFSSMIWPSELEEFNKTTQGEFSGVGISIQSEDDGSLKVVSPLEDSPAYNAGIKAGDIIDRINGKNAKGITLNQAVKTITGPPGTKVVLTIRSEDGTVTDYSLTRQTIKVASVKGWRHLPGGGWDYYLDPTEQIAYLRVTNFTKTTADELERAIADLAQAKALVLDLRYNPGGLLQAATEVSDQFLTKGTIVSTRADRDTPNHPTEAVAHDDGEEYARPVVVLVNQYSASASEIVAGALKDLDRALVVGERTFGKGSVQMLFPLARRQAYLKLTTSHYYLPSGRCIHREENSELWGVDPDLTIEMTPEQMKAAIDARQELDVLREAGAPAARPPSEPEQAATPATAPADAAVVATRGAKKDALGSDPQLNAALLLLRMQLAGAHI